MPKLTVNGIEVEVPLGATVMQACEAAGAEIPRFCYHERLSIAGNCRMCLVEQEKAPKPIASCAMPAGDGMVIHTDTPMVKKARRGVMEFLLINHPLDCPICDQGGECDLQDQAMGYGYDRSRFAENKRSVKDKNLGPIIKTYMNRCIHCTRCVRFASEVAGVPEMGATGRGENTEIGTYIEAALSSELSGNLVDLCPVGALTAKPYSFAARPWELRKTLSVDVLDALGSAIRIDSRGNEVLRILPRTHDAINEEWISDKTRHAVDGLRTRRLDRPLLRVDNRLEPIEWSQAFALLGGKIKAAKPEHIAALTGPLCDAEAIFALKQMMTKLGVVNTDCRPAGSILGTAANNGKVNLGATRFNSSIAGIDSADLILIIGSNPRWEAAVLNARIRKRYLTGKVKIALVGAAVDLTYPYLHLGDDASVLKDLTNGKTKGEVETFRSQLLAAESPMVIVGDGVFAREDAAALTVALDQFIDHFGIVRDGWNGYNCLQRSTGIATGLEVGFIPGLGGKSTAEIFKAANGGEMELLYLLGVDEFDLAADCKTFIVYQGHHGDAGAHRADLILPAAAYSEKSATYFNLEGRPQLAALATFPPGEAREDWKIIRALAEPCGVMLDYIDLGQLRAVMAREIPSLKNIGQITKVSWTGLGGAAGTAGTAGSALSKTPLGLAISDFYLTDPISRASKTMQNCSKLLVHGEGQPDPLEAEAVYG